MPNPENIEKHKWKKGQSGNPAGRKKGTRAFKTILNDYLEAKIKRKNPLTGKNELRILKDALMLSLLNEGLHGNIPAIKEIIDRAEGPDTSSAVIESLEDRRMAALAELSQFESD
jgi:hypothetical protein